MDRSCKLESVVLEGTWLLIALSEYVHPIFSRICLWCYCLKRTPLNVIMKQLNVMEICVAKSLSIISRVNTKRTVPHQIQSLPLKQNGKHHKSVYEQKLKRVSTYFICFNHFNGAELTVIYFFNIPFSMQKGRFLPLNPLLNSGGVIFLFKTNLFQPVLFPITLYSYFADSQHLMQ